MIYSNDDATHTLQLLPHVTTMSLFSVLMDSTLLIWSMKSMHVMICFFLQKTHLQSWDSCVLFQAADCRDQDQNRL